MTDVEGEYQEATQMLASATEKHERTFYNSVLRGLHAELMMMTSQGDTLLNEADNTPINE
jgi:hypothetical protein